MSSNFDTTQFLSTLNQAQTAQQSARINNLQGQAADQRSIDAVSKEFSSVMITQLLNILFEHIEVDPNFGGGHGEETWRSVLLDEYGKQIGNAGGLGIADMVKQQLLKYQEI